MAGVFANEDAAAQPLREAQFNLSFTCSVKLELRGFIVEIIEDRNKNGVPTDEFLDLCEARIKNDGDMLNRGGCGVWFEGPKQVKELANYAKIPLVREGCAAIRDQLLDKTFDDEQEYDGSVQFGSESGSFPVLELTDDGWELVRAPPVGCADDQVQVQPPGKVDRLCSWFGKQVKSCFLKR